MSVVGWVGDRYAPNQHNTPYRCLQSDLSPAGYPTRQCLPFKVDGGNFSEDTNLVSTLHGGTSHGAAVGNMTAVARFSFLDTVAVTEQLL